MRTEQTDFGNIISKLLYYRYSQTTFHLTVFLTLDYASHLLYRLNYHHTQQESSLLKLYVV